MATKRQLLGMLRWLARCKEQADERSDALSALKAASSGEGIAPLRENEHLRQNDKRGEGREGTPEPSDFDALMEHHKATEAENALFKRALEYIRRRRYHGASYVADNALAGVDVTGGEGREGER